MSHAVSAVTITVSGPTQGNITAAIGAACDGTTAGTVTFPNGSYAVTSSLRVPGNCTLQAALNGKAIINAKQNQIFTFNGNGIKVNGLVLDGGWMAFGNTNANYSNFTFTNNTVRNLTNSGPSGGPPALTLPGISGALIGNNAWLNIWGGGGSGYPNAPPVCTNSCDGTGIDSWGAGAIVGNVGNDHLVITNNIFDKIASDSIHLSWDQWLGNANLHINTSGNVISYNVFTHQRRIPIEIQSVANGCPGGCAYQGPSTLGMQIKGNYVHDYSFPFYDTWGASLVPDFARNNVYMNNTFIANVADGSSVNGWAPCMESAGDALTSQGNVCANTAGSRAFSSWFAQGSGYATGSTNNYTNSIICGNPGALDWGYDGQPSAYYPTVATQYDYLNGSSCPAGSTLTTSSIVQAFTTPDNQSIAAGAVGTWRSSAISNLSIKYVQYFLDGASTPIATQELQDVNTNFAADRKWLYHATLPANSLTGGAHTISALVTDVSGGTQTMKQTFMVSGGGGAVTSPTATLAPASLSFTGTTVGQAAQTQTVTLTNGGTAALAIGSMVVQGSHAADFTQSSKCGSSLAAAGSCSVVVSFTPSASGARTGTLVLSDNAASSPQSVALSGTGNAVAVPANVTAKYTTSTIAAVPPDGVHYEKVIGYFTSTAYPSFFLGTDKAAYIFDTTAGITVAVAKDGAHYESAKSVRFAGDKFDSVIASDNNALVLYENPANSNGGNANTSWKRFVISGSTGCHDLYVADMDGDGLSDVTCSGTYFLDDQSFVVFQNSRENWSQPFIDAAPAGDGVALVSIKGLNGGARTSVVGCAGGNLYWYQNPGGAAARSANWTRHYIGDCNAGTSLAALNIGDRDIVIQAANEEEPVSWASGFAYFDPGSNPYGTWTKKVVDSTYRAVHQIACDTLAGVPFCTLGEQEQASATCNSQNYNLHPGVPGCRVAIFPWNGSGFGPSTVVSNTGTQNQALLQVNGVEYMAGANHHALGGYDDAYHLWKFTFGSSTVPPPPDGAALAMGKYNFRDSSGNTLDSGWDNCCHDQVMHEYTYNNNAFQQFVLSASGTLCSVGSSLCLSDQGGVLTQTAGDDWAILQSGSGYVIQSKNTKRYLNPAAQTGANFKVTLSATPSVWTPTLQSGGGTPPPAATALAAGSYVMQDASANALDGGWFLYGGGTVMHEWSFNAGANQTFAFSPTRTLCDTGTKQCLSDSNGTLVQSGSHTWTVMSSGNGYTVQNDTTKRYINPAGQVGAGSPVTLSASASVWNIH